MTRRGAISFLTMAPVAAGADAGTSGCHPAGSLVVPPLDPRDQLARIAWMYAAAVDRFMELQAECDRLLAAGLDAEASSLEDGAIAAAGEAAAKLERLLWSGMQERRLPVVVARGRVILDPCQGSLSALGTPTDQPGWLSTHHIEDFGGGPTPEVGAAADPIGWFFTSDSILGTSDWDDSTAADPSLTVTFELVGADAYRCRSWIDATTNPGQLAERRAAKGGAR